MMAGLKVPKDLTAEQYIAVEDSLLSSESGRAFLRMRDRKTAVLAMDEFHSAIRSVRGWFEASTAKKAEDVHLEVLRKELMEMASSIRKAKVEIFAMKPAETDSSKRINLATEELDAIVHATERATSDILNSAERVIEFAGKIKKYGHAEEADALEMEATNILISCGFQDITGQRISKVVATLRYLEERVDAMIRIWGIEGVQSDDVPIDHSQDHRSDAHLLNGPALHGAIDQNMVDSLLNGGDFYKPEPIPAPEPVPPPAVAAPPEVKPVSVPEPEPEPEPKKVESKKPEPKKAEPKKVEAPMPDLSVVQELDQSSIDSLFP